MYPVHVSTRKSFGLMSSASKVRSTAPASARPWWPAFRSLAELSTVNADTRADIQGSIRGRLGLAWDRVLIYATGGVAFGGFSTDITVAGTDFFGTPVFGSGNRSTTRVGWTVGGGLQYAVTDNWSVRAEYRFTDFGRINQTGIFSDTNPLILTPTAAFIGNRRIQQNQVQVGFDYKFNLWAPAPVVAKY